MFCLLFHELHVLPLSTVDIVLGFTQVLQHMSAPVTIAVYGSQFLTLYECLTLKQYIALTLNLA